MSFFVLLYYIYHENDTIRRLKTFTDEDDAGFDTSTFELRRAIMYMKGPNQFRRMNTKMERYWNTMEGKKKILEIGNQYYILESLRFLGESDAILDSGMIDIDEFHRIYEEYIRANAEWELNLSHAMKEQYAALLKKYLIYVQKPGTVTAGGFADHKEGHIGTAVALYEGPVLGHPWISIDIRDGLVRLVHSRTSMDF
jgi:hypothetical protein